MSHPHVGLTMHCMLVNEVSLAAYEDFNKCIPEADRAISTSAMSGCNC